MIVNLCDCECLSLRMWLRLTRQTQNQCQKCYKQQNYLAYKRFATVISVWINMSA